MLAAMNDNAAARLASILSEVQGYPRDQPAVQAWKAILGVEDERELPAAVAELYLQQQSIVKRVMALPADEEPDHLLAHMPRVSNIMLDLMQMRSVAMGHFSAQVTDAMIYSLRSCAVVLRRHGVKQIELSPDEVSKLMDMVRSVADEINDSDLPQSIKLLIFQRVRDIETALLLYKIGGVERVEEAIDLFFGTAMRLGLATPKEQAKLLGWFKKVAAAIQGIAPAVKAIATSTEVIHTTIDTISK